MRSLFSWSELRNAYYTEKALKVLAMNFPNMDVVLKM